MARVGGRNGWIAWPATAVCAVVVAALVYLATPGIPGAISFIGDTLRAASARGDASGVDAEPAEAATDCRSLYPRGLWVELVWTPQVLLAQNTAGPATTSALAQALAPAVRFTCTWTTDDGRTASTTLADVPAGSEAIAEATLTSEGFTCAADGERVHCERAWGEVTEIHDLRRTQWLSSVLTRWLPEDYGAQTVSRAFPG